MRAWEPTSTFSASSVPLSPCSSASEAATSHEHREDVLLALASAKAAASCVRISWVTATIENGPLLLVTEDLFRFVDQLELLVSLLLLVFVRLAVPVRVPVSGHSHVCLLDISVASIFGNSKDLVVILNLVLFG